MSIKNTNIFHCKTPKIGIFGLKIYHLATLKYTTGLNSIRFHLSPRDPLNELLKVPIVHM
jgi:hypothetical protein